MTMTLKIKSLENQMDTFEYRYNLHKTVIQESINDEVDESTSNVLSTMGRDLLIITKRDLDHLVFVLTKYKLSPKNESQQKRYDKLWKLVNHYRLTI